MIATTGYVQMLDRPVSDEVFILDLTRQDGSRFVTSVSTPGGVSAARMRHKGVAGAVSHWKRDGDPFSYAANYPMTPDWRLNERFSL